MIYIYTIPQGKPFQFLLSFDDGKKEDYRLVQLLDKYGFWATFFIPSQAREVSDTWLREISKHHIIGAHTKHHKILTSIPPEKAKKEIEEGKLELEAILGKPVTSFCYPRGRYNSEIMEMVERAGFTDARTTRVFHTERSHSFELHTTIHIYNRNEYHGIPWQVVAREYFDKVLSTAPDDYFHLWGHSWEIEKYGWWEDFEDLLQYMSERLTQCGREDF